MLLTRCKECASCKYVEATRRIVLAEANGPISHATDSTARMWKTVLYDNPCDNWTDCEREQYREEIMNSIRSREVRPQTRDECR